MTIQITETTVTHRYLMNKSKSDLQFWLNDQRKATNLPPLDRAYFAMVTKAEIAGEIMKSIRAAEQKEAAEPQAFDDFNIPFGCVTTDVDGKRWVFCGWGQTTVSKEAMFTRELQPGERVSLVTPYTYHCTTTATLLKKFPLLTYVRK